MTSGICSTRSRAYEKSAEHGERHHHHRGEDRVVDRYARDPHFRLPGVSKVSQEASRRRSCRRRRLERLGVRDANGVGRSGRGVPSAAVALAFGGAASGRLHQRGRAFLQVVEARGQHLERRGQCRLELDPAGLLVAAARSRPCAARACRPRSPTRTSGPPRCAPRSPAATAPARWRRARRGPVANMPPRSSLFGLGMPTNTRIARVPGSVAGLMRSMRPVNLRSPKPSTVRSTVMPALQLGNVDGRHHRLQLDLLAGRPR